MYNFGPPPRCPATRCLQRSAPIKGSTVLITGASFRLRSKGSCQRQHRAEGRLHPVFANEKGKPFFWKLSCLWIFSSFCEWPSAALRLSSPDLPPAELTEDRESRFSFDGIPAFGNGKARSAQAQCLTFQRSVFHLWASALSVHSPAWRMPAPPDGKVQKATFPAFSAPR